MFHHFLSGFSSTLAHPPGICKASPYQAQYGVYNKDVAYFFKRINQYRTGPVNDPQLTERLHKAKVSFNEVIKEKDSPFTNFLIAWILPILIFFGISYYFNRKLMNRGGGNSLMFGAKNQVKVYVPSANGIHFDDVAGEDEAKENLSEIVDFLHHPDKYAKIGAKMPKGVLLGGDTSLACAPETQKYIDAKVVSVVKEQHAKAKKMLEDHRPALDALAQYLYEKETITGKEFMDILGKCSC